MLSLHTLHKKMSEGRDGVEEVIRYLTESEALEYYGEGQAAPMAIQGDIWSEFGISDEKPPAAPHLRNLLAGYGPNGERTARIGRNHRCGNDMTFSAPKSVSVVWALADPEIRRAIEAAHDDAVSRAVDHAGQYLIVRSGQGGERRELAQCTGGVAFRHTTSRAGDPQLHSHYVLFNLGKTADGEWRRLDPSEVYRRKHEIGAIYRAQLADNLRKMGFAIRRHDNYFEIDGLDQKMIDNFSKRSSEISKEVGRKIFDNWKTRQEAALKTRAAKRISTPDLKHAFWMEEARMLGWTDGIGGELKNVRQQRYSFECDNAVEALGRRKATFGERQIDLAAAISLQGIDGAEGFEAGRQKIYSEPELLRLRPARNDEDDRHRRSERFTTARNRLTEIEMIALARRSVGDGHGVGAGILQKAIERVETTRGIAFSPEQRKALLHMACGRDGIRLVEGVAGAGKTVLVDVLREAYDFDGGRRVTAVALAGKAASGIGIEAGVTHRTADSLVRALERDGPLGIRRGDVIVMDESGMTDTALTLDVIRSARKLGCDLVMIGDEKQLQPITAGAAFSALRGELGSVHLTESRRQRDEAHREAMLQARGGNAVKAVAWFEEHKKLTFAGESGILETVERWKSAIDAGVGHDQAIMLSNRRSAVYELNQSARRTIGLDAGPQVRVAVIDRGDHGDGDRNFTVGDRIIGTKNNRRIGLMNGELGTITDIRDLGSGNAFVEIRKDNGRKIAFTSHEYRALNHAYALTVHQAQGVSVEASVCHVGDPDMTDLHSFYVAITRSRDAEHSHIVIPEYVLDDNEQLLGLDVERGEGERTPRERLQKIVESASRDRIDRVSIDWSIDIAWAERHNPRLAEAERRHRAKRTNVVEHGVADEAARRRRQERERHWTGGMMTM